MKSEIICVGTELLVGDILNTNAKYISEKLAEIGINLYYQTVVGDNHERLKEVLKSAAKRADLVIITGGLGPTIDDITKETIADYYNENLVIVDKYYDILVERYKQMGRTDIPHGGDKEASILENSKLLELIVSDTIPLKRASSKIIVVSCAPLFADVMHKVQDNRSISGQFLM